jgi:uncharacterized protein YndB with AHSA1/START domain
MTQATDTSVVRTALVRAPIQRAFKVFTEDMGAWWDADHHLVDGFERMEVELRVGGRITDVGKDGQTCTWSRVLAYEPPRRFVFSWDISLQWQVETDPAKASEVEVLFEPEGDATRVTLTHRHLDRHGDGWEQMAAAVGAPNGWDLTAYAELAAAP